MNKPIEANNSVLRLSQRHQLFLGLFLLLLMVATRGEHFATLQNLPGASWAVFFLAGVYLRPAWFFPGLLVGAALIDYVAITWGGVSSFCITPAYVLLIPAYGVLWFAGRLYAHKHKDMWQTLIPLALSVVAATLISDLISSGGFYYFSGRFVDTNLLELFARILKYTPGYLANMAFYVGCAALIHAIVIGVKSASDSQPSAT